VRFGWVAARAREHRRDEVAGRIDGIRVGDLCAGCVNRGKRVQQLDVARCGKPDVSRARPDHLEVGQGRSSYDPRRGVLAPEILTVLPTRMDPFVLPREESGSRWPESTAVRSRSRGDAECPGFACSLEGSCSMAISGASHIDELPLPLVVGFTAVNPCAQGIPEDNIPGARMVRTPGAGLGSEPEISEIPVEAPVRRGRAEGDIAIDGRVDDFRTPTTPEAKRVLWGLPRRGGSRPLPCSLQLSLLRLRRVNPRCRDNQPFGGSCCEELAEGRVLEGRTAPPWSVRWRPSL